jgi:hypothetical protein
VRWASHTTRRRTPSSSEKGVTPRIRVVAREPIDMSYQFLDLELPDGTTHGGLSVLGWASDTSLVLL